MRNHRDILESYGGLENHPCGVWRIWCNKNNGSGGFSLSYSSLDIMYDDLHSVMLSYVENIEAE